MTETKVCDTHTRSCYLNDADFVELHNPYEQYILYLIYNRLNFLGKWKL